MSNEALAALAGEFSALYATTGRPSIPPEKLLRAMLLQAVYSIRSERQLIERLDFDMLFRWFVGLGIDDCVWDHSTFSKNRDRLLDGDVAAKFLAAVLAQPHVKRLLSNDHISVDGTLIEAWASMKSFAPKGAGENPENKMDEPPSGSGGSRNREADFHGEKRSNHTHASTSDPDARLITPGSVLSMGLRQGRWVAARLLEDLTRLHRKHMLLPEKECTNLLRGEDSDRCRQGRAREGQTQGRVTRRSRAAATWSEFIEPPAPHGKSRTERVLTLKDRSFYNSNCIDAEREIPESTKSGSPS